MSCQCNCHVLGDLGNSHGKEEVVFRNCDLLLAAHDMSIILQRQHQHCYAELGCEGHVLYSVTFSFFCSPSLLFKNLSLTECNLL